MSYITEPQPCDPWCTRKGKFSNLGGYGNYPALQEIHENDHLSRYMYHPHRRPCCQDSHKQLEYIRKHHVRAKPLGSCRAPNCNSNIHSHFKDQENYISPTMNVEGVLDTVTCLNPNISGFDVTKLAPSVWSGLNDTCKGLDSEACKTKALGTTGGVKIFGPVPTESGFYKDSTGSLAIPGWLAANSTRSDLPLPGTVSCMAGSAGNGAKTCQWITEDIYPPTTKYYAALDGATSCTKDTDCTRNSYYCGNPDSILGKGYCSDNNMCVCDPNFVNPAGTASCNPKPTSRYTCDVSNGKVSQGSCGTSASEKFTCRDYATEEAAKAFCNKWTPSPGPYDETVPPNSGNHGSKGGGNNNFPFTPGCGYTDNNTLPSVMVYDGGSWKEETIGQCTVGSGGSGWQNGCCAALKGCVFGGCDSCDGVCEALNNTKGEKMYSTGQRNGAILSIYCACSPYEFQQN